MQNRTLSLSLLMSAALAIPSLAMAADADEMTNVTPADMRTTPVDNTLQAEVEGPDGELLATQPGAIETNEAEAVAMADMGDEVEVSEDMADDVDIDSDANVVQAEALQPAQTSQALNMQHSNPDYQPLLSGENATGEQAADTAITLQEKEKDSRGELLATQPADIEASESRRISVR
ncbi:hypothetical protein J3492_04340 [Psychrobacter sp. F1192]|uniref:Uncharacterized protein n=1 Tax=Psychrobacter coccoides TaxID=2818440 RepID=A0ABS3NM01_9GAMM|nr:hypothetical protein [Psychrobacter coccoides]MBO1530442.1 hypothetical protein [Psychrobacter coccoides]